MVWRCMSSVEVGNLNFIDSKINKFVYLSFLKQNVKQSAKKFSIALLFTKTTILSIHPELQSFG